MNQSDSRRRWLTLAELVAVAGVVIAALSLYLTWSDRREAATEKAGETRAKEVILFEGTPEHGGTVLRLTDPQHKVQSVSLRFPAALEAGVREALVEPRIEADWIARPLLKLTDGGADAAEGKLPVLVTATWWDADTRHTDRAVYDLVWRTEGRLLRGRALRLEGVVLREHGGSPARIEQLWTTEKPGS